METPAWVEGAEARELAGSIDVAGIVVAIWRVPGRSTLLLEVVMARKAWIRARPVDSGTADITTAHERASAFAEAYAELHDAPCTGEDGIAKPTCGELAREIERQGKDTPNRKTQLRAFMRIFALEDDDVVGDVFGDSFDIYLQTFRSKLEQEGKTSATISSYVSRLRDIRDIAAGMRKLKTEGLTFAHALDTAIRASGFSEQRIATAVGTEQSTVNTWRRGGSQPRECYYPKVIAIEVLLGLSAGTLTELLPPAMPGSRRVPSAFTAALREGVAGKNLSQRQFADAIGVSIATVFHWLQGGIPGPKHRGSIGKIEEVLGKEPGALAALLPPLPISAFPYAAEFTPCQEIEWQALFDHKTNPDEPDEARRPAAIWRVKSDGTCPTGDICRKRIREFYGCLALPPDASDPRQRGLGLPSQSLSLLNLANLKHVQYFIRFLKKRAGAYNGNTEWFIEFASSMLRRLTGFLSQGNDVEWRTFPLKDLQPDATVPDGELTIEQWRAHCAAVREKLREWLKYLKRRKLLRKTRDYAHIDAALRLDHPAKVLVLLERRMRAYVAKRWHHAEPLERALMARDLLLVCMINRNPLRLSHWMIMTWTADGRGHLFKRPDGHYSLRYTSEEFKAVAKMRGEDYDAEVDPSLTPMIDEYLLIHRPLLCGATMCDLVFRPKRGKKGDHARFMNIAIRLSKGTEKFIPEYAPRGFNPHGWRHIIPTDLVKNHENGVTLAADALHNTEQMIEKHYGHLSSTERTKRAQRIISETLERGAEKLDAETF